MSKENVKKFFEELDANLELKKNFEAVMSDCASQSEDLFLTKTVEFANGSGFSCTVSDISQAFNECGEVSDEEMQKASRGFWRVYPPAWWYQKQYSKNK